MRVRRDILSTDARFRRIYTQKDEEIETASVQFGNGSTIVVPKSGVEAGVWNDALRPRVAVPRLLRGKRASRQKPSRPLLHLTHDL
jgi:hypothetical protein